jgi:hypothetical protein
MGLQRNLANAFLIHTFHLSFIPEGVAEASQIFLRGAHVLPKLFSYEIPWSMRWSEPAMR